MEEKLMNLINDLVLENLIALKVEEEDDDDDDQSTCSSSLARINEKQAIKDRIQRLIEFMTSLSQPTASRIEESIKYEMDRM